MLRPQTKTFTESQFLQAMRAFELVAVDKFWRELERLAQPEERTRFHAESILRAFAESVFEMTDGVALSPAEATAFRRSGLAPVRVAAPGELGS